MTSQMELNGNIHSTNALRAYERSFFSKSLFPLSKWLLLLHFWLNEFPVKDTTDDAVVHKNTAGDVYTCTCTYMYMYM